MNIISEMLDSKKSYLFKEEAPVLFEEFKKIYDTWGVELQTEGALKEFAEVIQQELNLSEKDVLANANESVAVGIMTSEQRDMLRSGLSINEQLPPEEDEDALPDDEETDTGEEEVFDEPGGEPPDPEEKEKAITPETDKPEAPEKEYFGDRREGQNMEQVFFVQQTGDSGDIEDLVIVDAEEKPIISAKDRGMDITNIEEFLRDAINGLDLEKLSPDILARYNYLNVMPEEEEVEELLPEEGEAIGQKEELPAEGAIDFDKTAPLERRHSVSILSEDRDQVLNKAGVSSDDWFRSEDTIYFRGVGEDEARAIAAELGGRLVSAKEFEGKKFYAVVLEGKVSFANFIENKGLNSGDILICDSEEPCKELLGVFGGKLVGEVKVGGKTFYKILFENVNEQYNVLASGISDEKTADELARNKKGTKIQDPDNPDKWLVISKEE